MGLVRWAFDMIGILQLEERQPTENENENGGDSVLLQPGTKGNEANNESSTSHSDSMGSKREGLEAQYHDIIIIVVIALPYSVL